MNASCDRRFPAVLGCSSRHAVMPRDRRQAATTLFLATRKARSCPTSTLLLRTFAGLASPKMRNLRNVGTTASDTAEMKTDPRIQEGEYKGLSILLSHYWASTTD